MVRILGVLVMLLEDLLVLLAEFVGGPGGIQSAVVC